MPYAHIGKLWAIGSLPKSNPPSIFSRLHCPGPPLLLHSDDSLPSFFYFPEQVRERITITFVLDASVSRIMENQRHRVNEIVLRSLGKIENWKTFFSVGIFIWTGSVSECVLCSVRFLSRCIDAVSASRFLPPSLFLSFYATYVIWHILSNEIEMLAQYRSPNTVSLFTKLYSNRRQTQRQESRKKGNEGEGKTTAWKPHSLAMEIDGLNRQIQTQPVRRTHQPYTGMGMRTEMVGDAEWCWQKVIV